ncbi:MAG TPA: CehA/McbA family metallohydrolase [Polyangia bacterium]|nr:CehA/McbA family metallohydrolase [Polyangia bacterium]
MRVPLPSRLPIPVAALGFVLAAVAVLAPGCSDALLRPLRGGGAVLWRVGSTRNPPVTPVQGRDGDLALLNSALAVLVASDAGDPRRRQREGSIVGALTSAAEGGELEELRTILRSGGTAIALEVIRVRAEKRDGVPSIVIRSRSESPRLEVTTRVTLTPAGPTAVIETAVENTGDTPLPAFQIGDRVSWPDGSTFAPGTGFAAEPGKARAPWIGRRGKDASYALAFADGEAAVEFEAEPHGPLGAAALSEPKPLAAGAWRTWRRTLVVTPGGLEGAAREAWTVRGVPLAEIRGILSPTPAWAAIEVNRGDGRAELIAEAAPDGSFGVFVPAGRYEIVARAPGGEDRVPVEALADATVVVGLTPPTPGVLRFLVIGADGGPLPARLVIRGVRPTRDPKLGPRHVARGAENIVYAARGEGAVELPVGRYRVTATHGLEFSVTTAEIAVAEGKGAMLRTTLDREFDPAGWIAAEFHIHAEPSFDSSVSLQDRVTSLLAEGIGFSVATDHNVVTDYGPAINDLGATEILGSARGVEVTTERPKWGHFNVWPYPAGEPTPPFSGQDPRAILAAIRAAAPGAILQVNHPRMMQHNIGYFGIGGLDTASGVAANPDYSPDFDAVEVWNGMDNNDLEVTYRNVAEWFELLNLGLRYTATGNSDSHVLIYQWAGYPRNWVRTGGAGIPTPEAMAEAVRAGRVQVSSGPFIALKVGGGEPGDLVAATGGRVRTDVEVLAAAWVDTDVVEIWVGGELAAESALAKGGNGALRGRLGLWLPVPRDSWVVAVVRGDTPLTEVLPYTKLTPFAFTNPVFVDADGDGRFTAPNAPVAGLDAGAPDAGPDSTGPI